MPAKKETLKKVIDMRSALTLALLLTTVLTSIAFADTPQDKNEAEPVRYKITTGLDYSKGDFGDTQDTEMWYAPVTMRAQYKNWTAKVTVPYLRIKGPGAVVGSGDTSVTSAGGAPVTTEEGLGDIVASLMYTYDLDAYDLSFDFTGKVKFPTGDEDKGLSTGERDYTLATEVTKTIGKAYVSANVGHKFVGSNDTLNLHDIWIAGVGAGYKLSDKWDTGVSYDWRQSASNGTQPRDATLYFNYKITKQTNIQAYAVKGFSDASADLGGGLMVGYKF